MSPLARRHLKIGWLAIAVFSMMGIALEAAHGFKLGLYLDVGNETRRLMWTLAHAHGALLGLVHVGFAVSLDQFGLTDRARRFCSLSTIAALVLLPVGFFLAGLEVYGGDPGRAIVLVPLGAVALVLMSLKLAFSSFAETRPDA